MKTMFSSQYRLFLLISFLMWPLSSLAISEMEFDHLINNADQAYIYCDRNHSKMAEVIEEISKFDENRNSLIWQLHDHMQKGFSIAREDAIIDALVWAALFLDKNRNNLNPHKFEQIRSDLNAVMNAVADDQLTVDVESLIDNQSFRAETNKIYKPTKFYKDVTFKDKADFKHFVGFHGNAHFHKNVTVDDLLTAGNEIVDCDLTVGCNISINDSVSPAIGNIIKNGIPFIHNYPGFISDNTFVGDYAGNFTMTGDNNSGFGAYALNAVTNGSDDTAVGYGALEYNTIGLQNTAVGSFALNANVVGDNNTAVGYDALSASLGYENTAVGSRALLNNQFGNANTAAGAHSLEFNVNGHESTAFGYQAMQNQTEGYNAAFGYKALQNNTVATENAAFGWKALAENIDGEGNTALGNEALEFNTTGYDNTATGDFALSTNTTGYNNTATGYAALYSNNTGYENAAFGVQALYNNTTGFDNTAIGNYALFENTIGFHNIAAGTSALENLTTGSNNIALGYGAGIFFTSAENNNIDIGNTGVTGESGIIRIGTFGTHNAAYMQGIYTTTVIGVPVEVNVLGQLGVAPSSEQFKKNVRNMGVNSEDIYKLRPVTFEYKDDANNNMQYGLIAEEVANVCPSLVVNDKDNNPYTVRYQVLPVLLLNEVQKQHASIEALAERVAHLEKHAPAA